jgi:hypothetical protein
MMSDNQFFWVLFGIIFVIVYRGFQREWERQLLIKLENQFNELWLACQKTTDAFAAFGAACKQLGVTIEVASEQIRSNYEKSKSRT